MLNLLIVSMAVWTAPDGGEISVAMVAVDAATEGHGEKRFDPQLQPLRATLARTDADTFRRIKKEKVTGPYGKEFEFAINEQYTLVVTPVSKQRNGVVRLETRIWEKSKDTTKKLSVNAVKATSMLAPGDKLCLGGPKLDSGGKLIVILTVEEPRPLMKLVPKPAQPAPDNTTTKAFSGK